METVSKVICIWGHSYHTLATVAKQQHYTIAHTLANEITIVTRFAKRGLPHTSNLQTLKVHTLELEKDIDWKFGQ